MKSFLWHDYETWGVNPALDKPCQFAAIRTDEQFTVIGEPMMWYCKPTNDCLPHPEAVMVTGITPQHAWQKGIPEPQFMANIHQQMIQPNTCTVGFNSLRFDDEVTRFGLYRNFYDAYEREWKNGNSRFDLIDVLRLCAALRPEGIHWPVDEAGLPSFRLEALTKANGIEQQGAHDALIDVRATIDVAKLLHQHQPKLLSYALTMRDKQTVTKIIALGSRKPLLHVSGMFGSVNHCISMVLPLCMHPSNKNAVICFDLRESPEDFLNLSVADIRERVFSNKESLGDKKRIPLKSIHINKCPMIVPASMLTPEVSERVGLNSAVLRKHYDELLLGQAVWIKAQDVFKDAYSDEPERPAETALYGGGFFSHSDKALCQQVRQADSQQLTTKVFEFEDKRLNQLLFLYKARHFPESLHEQEQIRWQALRFERLTDENAAINLEAYQHRLESLFEQHHGDDKKQQLLSDLADWGDALLN